MDEYKNAISNIVDSLRFFGKVLNAIIPNPFTTYNDNISADDFSDDSIDDDDIYYIPAIQRKKIAN